MNRKVNLTKRKLVNGMVLLLLVFAVGGCARKDEKPAEKQQEKVPDVQYETGNVTAFCVDEQGKIYTCEEGTETINVYDTEGTKLSEIRVDGGTESGSRYTVLCAGDGVLYASDSVEKGIAAIDIATGERELLYTTQDPGHWSLRDMTVCNGSLYFIYQKPVELAEMQLLTDYAAGYNYIGERVACLELATKKAEEMEVPGVKRLCKKSAIEILFYAFDEENGFTYRVYDTETGSYSAEYEAKQELDLRMADVMTYDASMERLLYPDSTSGQLRAIDITKKASETEFYGTGLSGFGTHSLQCVDGCTYFVSGGKVTKIDNRSYIKETEPLKIASISRGYKPVSSLGYQVSLEYLESDEMALKLLAGDSDFDLMILSSEYDLAGQIERTGAYEALNEVEGIEEYLENCFDYIGDAATADNGAVWMLPYEVETSVFVYQPEVCEKYGVDFSGELTYEAFLDDWKELQEVAVKDSLQINIRTIWWQVVQQYIADYAVKEGEAQFDTEVFRTWAPILKEIYENEGSSWISTELTAGMTLEELREEVQKFYDSCAFGILDKMELEQEYGMRDYVNGVSYVANFFDFDFFEARSMPSIVEGEEKSGVAHTCFYVVNPNSKRKEEAKEYLATLAESLAETESIYRTKELKGEYSKLEVQVHDVYADAEIFFAYPADVVGAEYMEYLTGEINLEELIQEAERKFNIYLKE